MYRSIFQILKSRAEQHPDAVALLAPGREPLSYRSLYLHVERTVKQLRAHGIRRGDRVAIVMPNGPDMATAFLGVACGATSAPLNPDNGSGEFEYYLTDLRAKALLIPIGWDSPARASAQARGIPVIQVSLDPGDPAGQFAFSERLLENETAALDAGPDDVALVLHTSGTTSRPKAVPLTHQNICASADRILTTLRLSARDRCLNVMPLFHVHGLIASLLSTLSAGGCVVCTPGFTVDGFFDWLQTFRPTWYSAVPTMHQNILSHAPAHQEAISRSPLRLVRSSSSPLPPPVMKGLEDVFGAPVIEAYGMTEASHQIASNPLPPLPRKPGTVGLPGLEIRIIDEGGRSLSPGQPGEIAIRGESVISAYDGNPEANRTAFADGWFRTGDEGVIDADGYLSITGRLTDMVNRGGEKIAPRDVDEALLDHPDVLQAVAFAVPHPTLGEDLAAAVVLRANSEAAEGDLRQFAFSRLAPHKVPSRIVVVDKIPLGPSGKPRRKGLAQELAPRLDTAYAAPRDALERALTEIWETALQRPSVGVLDNFFALGGDSIVATSVLAAVGKSFCRHVEASTLFRVPTVEGMAAVIRDGAGGSFTHAVPLRARGSRKPLFLVPGDGGDIFTYVELARHLHPEQPVHVFEFPEAARHDTKVANALIKEMAGAYVGEMAALQPTGPYYVGGFCFGGKVALEIAQQLRARGQQTALVAIIYLHLGASARPIPFRLRAARRFKTFVSSDFRGKTACLADVARHASRALSSGAIPFLFRHTRPPSPERTYAPEYFPGRLTLFEPLEGPYGGWDPYMGWQGRAATLDTYAIPGSRYTAFKEPHVRELARQLQSCLDHSTPA